MPYTYDYNEATRIGTVLLDGVAQFQIDAEINPRLHGHVATWHAKGKLNDPDVLIDAVAKRVRITSIALDETVKDENSRDEVVALLSEFASQLETDVGLTQARSRALVRILWKFLKRALTLMGR